jgi:NTP pyrophosphatase (non-canonical NTP hydrolase)
MQNFDQYQREVGRFAIDLSPSDAWTHGILGLVGEAGELAEKFKKQVRDGKPVHPEDLCKELGDVLWYVAYLAGLYGYPLSVIAQANYNKLSSRAERGVLSGSGDNR